MHRQMELKPQARMLIMRRTTLAALLVSPIALVACGRADSAQALNVYAATSLSSAFSALDRGPRYSFGGSNTLQMQIERGAPADVFASASPGETQALFRKGLCTRPVTFAVNRLVLLVPDSNPGHVTSVHSLRRGGRRLSIGTVGVPVGVYTRTLLTRMRLSSILRSNRVSQQTNVGQVASQVALGSADAGFVYYTDALAVKDRTRVIGLPEWAQPAVRYQACGVRRSGADTRGARAFIEKLSSGAGRAALKARGFGLPPRS
jgi:molybdate transport system substrate-binding protein